jgi:hypothetical protein
VLFTSLEVSLWGSALLSFEKELLCFPVHPADVGTASGPGFPSFAASSHEKLTYYTENSTRHAVFFNKLSVLKASK